MARSRRGRGEGSVFQRADGRWVASVNAGYSASGKRRRQTVYGATKREAMEKLREISTRGIPDDASRTSVREYMTLWLSRIQRSRGATTHLRYEQIVRLHVVPHIGHLRLSKLSPAHVEQMIQDLARDDVSESNQEKACRTLGTACREAVRLRLIPTNPVRDIRKPRVAKKQLQVWTQAEASQFLDAAKGDRLSALYVLALASGLRQGELFALQWADIDFEAGTVAVTKSLEEIKGRLTIKPPKTPQARRTVSLPRFAVDALHDHRKQMLAEGHAGGPVFCDGAGGYLRKSNVHRRSFVPVLHRAEVPVIRFHDLRHTCATLLLLRGVNAKVVSERLGHASITITLHTYAHVLPSMQQAAADELDELFG